MRSAASVMLGMAIMSGIYALISFTGPTDPSALLMIAAGNAMLGLIVYFAFGYEDFRIAGMAFYALLAGVFSGFGIIPINFVSQGIIAIVLGFLSTIFANKK